MQKSNYHVTKHPNGWQAKKEGSARASTITKRQSDAEQLAKRYSFNNGGGEVRIHGRDGRIRDSDTVKPANDPCPPKDKVH